MTRKTFTLTFISAVLCGLIASAALVGHGLTTSASSPLSCVLLVDDDQDNPDVRMYYTSTLDELRACEFILSGRPGA